MSEDVTAPNDNSHNNTHNGNNTNDTSIDIDINIDSNSSSNDTNIATVTNYDHFSDSPSSPNPFLAAPLSPIPTSPPPLSPTPSPFLAKPFAFADDLAITFTDLTLLTEHIIPLIDLFREISGLGVNLDKTKIISTRNFKKSDRERMKASAWPSVCLEAHATYLGVPIGRGVTSDDFYAAPLDKFSRLVSDYGPILSSLPLNHKIIAINVFLISLFSYHIQFILTPNSVLTTVRSACHKILVPWNGGGFAFEHLLHPPSKFGFHTPLKDLWALGLARLPVSPGQAPRPF
jgi:hypothetical protein